MKLFVSLGCLVLYMICYARLVKSDSCAVNFQGTSSVKLSAETSTLVGSSIGNYSVDYTKHTFDLWMNPNQFVADEQTVFQTGTVRSTEGTSWAVEVKIKLTIWQKGQSKPSSSVLYVDVWTMSHEEHAWSKTRHYIILAEESYPWLHVVHTPVDSNSITINGKSRRLDQYTTVTSSEHRPSENMAIGEKFKGAIADVKVWKSFTTNIQADECTAIGSNMLFYFPLNECGGESFSGYVNGENSCALMYGSYSASTLWTVDSPDVASCKPTSDQCKGATRVVVTSNSGQESSYRFNVPGGYKTVLILPVAVIAVVVLLRRNSAKRSPGTDLQV